MADSLRLESTLKKQFFTLIKPIVFCKYVNIALECQGNFPFSGPLKIQQPHQSRDHKFHCYCCHVNLLMLTTLYPLVQKKHVSIILLFI